MIMQTVPLWSWFPDRRGTSAQGQQKTIQRRCCCNGGAARSGLEGQVLVVSAAVMLDVALVDVTSFASRCAFLGNSISRGME